MIDFTRKSNTISTSPDHIADVGNMIDFTRKSNTISTSSDHFADVGNMITYFIIGYCF